ncbi:hypothetical protein PENTCL1PPCAC_17463, partial [Pristionchus entomophagus]
SLIPSLSSNRPLPLSHEWLTYHRLERNSQNPLMSTVSLFSLVILERFYSLLVQWPRVSFFLIELRMKFSKQSLTSPTHFSSGNMRDPRMNSGGRKQPKWRIWC